jgi:hypothetical protein
MMSSLLVLCACGARLDPELYVTVAEPHSFNIEAHVGSERAREQLQRVFYRAATDNNWIASPLRVTILPNRRHAQWESRGEEILLNLDALHSGRLAVSGKIVDLTGAAPSTAIAPMKLALERLFGPDYQVRVALDPVPDVEAASTVNSAEQSAPPPSAAPAYLDPARLIHRWTADISSSQYNRPAVASDQRASASLSYIRGTPAQELASESRVTIAIDDQTSCSVDPELLRTREARGRLSNEFVRFVTCSGGELDGGALGLPERNAAACTHPQDEPIRSGSSQGASWLVRRDGKVIGQLIITCYPEGALAR